MEITTLTVDRISNLNITELLTNFANFFQWVTEFDWYVR